ncbi:MAG: DegT/DnrJ/EryC1/StrS family aminotransferase [Candidatus Diapherotrites archaeon]
MLEKVPRFQLYWNKKIFLAGLKTILSGKTIEGPKIKEFEGKFSRYIGAKYAVSIPSGKMALYLSIKALKLERGSEIIVPAFTVPEVVSMVLCAGLKPVFIDIEKDSFNIDPQKIEEKITKKTSAILLTHLYGEPADIKEIQKIAVRHKLKIIEDCAQACGAEYNGIKAGNFGDASYFSFGLVKNLNTLGGGMVLSNNKKLIEDIRMETSNFSEQKKSILIKEFFTATILWVMTSRIIFSIIIWPLLRFIKIFRKNSMDKAFELKEEELSVKEILEHYKNKFSNFQALIGLLQLNELEKNNNKRIENAKILMRELKGIRMLKLPEERKGIKSIYPFLVVRVPTQKRDWFVEELFRKGIDCSKGNLKACNKMQLFKEFRARCSNAESAEKEVLYIPVHSTLNRHDMKLIAEKIRETIE